MATCSATASGISVTSFAVVPQRQQRLISSSTSRRAVRPFDVSQCRNLKLTVQRQGRKSDRGEAFICRAATYRVTLRTPQGEMTLTVADDVYILDAAADNGVSLPYSCRSGACSSCAAIVKSGKIDQSDQCYLADSQVDEGYVLTCVSYPLSDIVLETHQEHGLY